MTTVLRFRRIGSLAVLGGLAMAGIGCEAPGGASAKASARYFANISQHQALALAERALRQYDFRIEERNESAGRIRTYPLESTMVGGTGRLRDAVNYKNRVRRIAELRVLPVQQGVRVTCRVRLQRWDTGDYTTFGREHLVSDMPTETPIDRGDGMLASQKEAWTDVRDDRELQRRILETLAELIRGETGPASGRS